MVATRTRATTIVRPSRHVYSTVHYSTVLYCTVQIGDKNGGYKNKGYKFSEAF